MADWQDSVEEHREALEALANHGRTELAEDAAALLDEVDANRGDSVA